MVIAIDASRANRDHKSGTEWYSYYLIRWFAKLDKENQYILYSDIPLKKGLIDLMSVQDSTSILEKNCIPEYDSQGYQKINSPHNNFKAKILKWPYSFLWTQGRLSLEMLFNRADILFVPAHTLPLIHPKNSVVTIHDIGFAHNNRIYDCCQKMGPKNKASKKILNYLVKLLTFGKCGISSIEYLNWSTLFALKKASKVITISDFSKNDIINIYGDKYKDKINVIHNGYNKYLYNEHVDRNKIEQVLNRYNIYGEYIFYIGRLEKKKNIASLIKAFAKMRDENKSIKHKLVLVGDAGYGYSDINYLISDRDIEEEVIMPGWVDELDVPYLFTGASAFVFPSCYEGFGIPILQAMACGVPVIASDNTSIPEVAGGAALLFKTYDNAELADCIKKVITDKKLADSMREKGFLHVKKHSWEKCARETIEKIVEGF